MITYTPSFKLLAEYLEKNNYNISSVDLDGISTNFVLIQSNVSPARLIINAKSTTYPFPTASGRLIYRDKALTYAYVKSLGLSTPDDIAVTESSDERLTSFLLENKRVIVKPQDSHGSQGLSLNITTIESLTQAVKSAFEYSKIALVQSQFIGEEVRFTVVDGVVKSALLREKPHVIGDGSATIEQLIINENRKREVIVDTAVVYPVLDEHIVSYDLLHSQAVPANGERVELGLGTMIRTGASMYEVIDSIDRTYIDIVEKIAAPFGYGFLAVDMMIADIHQSAQPDSYIFLEINNDPALVLYYSCRDGRHFDIIQHILGPKLVRAIEGTTE